MRYEYDLNNLKTKFIVKDDHIIVEKNEKVFIFLVFYDKSINKMSILFKETYGDKLKFEDILIIQEENG